MSREILSASAVRAMRALGIDGICDDPENVDGHVGRAKSRDDARRCVAELQRAGFVASWSRDSYDACWVWALDKAEVAS